MSQTKRMLILYCAAVYLNFVWIRSQRNGKTYKTQAREKTKQSTITKFCTVVIHCMCRTLTAQQESSVEDLPKLKRCTAFINVVYSIPYRKRAVGFILKRKPVWSRIHKNLKFKIGKKIPHQANFKITNK